VSKRIYFVAGEASGDTHGAALMAALRELQQDVVFVGRGGPRMKAVADAEFTDWSDRSAVLGLWEVLKQYGYFRRQFAATLREVREQRPDAFCSSITRDSISGSRGRSAGDFPR
jgi:lipid-A-disaccharide synthase